MYPSEPMSNTLPTVRLDRGFGSRFSSTFGRASPLRVPTCQSAHRLSILAEAIAVAHNFIIHRVKQQGFENLVAAHRFFDAHFDQALDLSLYLIENVKDLTMTRLDPV